MTDILDRLRKALADRYTVERELGRGGMATVYLAEDLKHKRQVAIKLLDPELARALGSERFLREVEVTAKLTHPHILALYDSGEADGFLFYVMPYIEGETLRDRMSRDGQLPLDDALQITREIAAALSYAHSQGVIHRDIKPENVLLSAGEAVVADFGIARAITEAGGENLTETGISIGTPTYMSPEQAAGEKLDGRSDVYSLGCVLYEMLAGEPPYTGPSAQAIVAKKLSEPVPRVSVVREMVPRSVESTLERALAKAPADRFPTALAFSEALSTDAVTPRVQLRGWRRAVAALAAVVVLALAARGLASILAGEQVDTLAVLPLTDLTADPEQAYLAAGVHEALITELGQLGLSVTARATMAQFRDTDKPIREIASEVGADAVIEGSVYRSGDSLQIATRLYDREEREMWTASYAGVLSDIVALYRGFARAIANEIGVHLNPTNEARLNETAAVNPEVYEAYLRGMHALQNATTQEQYDSAFVYFQEAVDQNPADALAWAALAYGYVTLLHDFGAGSPELWLNARAAAERAIRLDSTSAEGWAALADYQTYYGRDWEAAEYAFRKANELNPSLPWNHYHYAWYLALFGRVDEAVAEHERAKALDPLTPAHTVWLPALYWWSEEPERAYDEARAVLEDYPDDLTALGVFQVGAAIVGNYDEAIEAWGKAAAISPPPVSGPGAIYAVAGRREDALRVAREMEAVGNYGGSWNIYAMLGNREEALRRFEHEPYGFATPWSWNGPAGDSLRDEPRFQEVFRRMNLRFEPGRRAPVPVPVVPPELPAVTDSSQR
jgi:serine/threonine-protein kinase